MSPSLSDQDRLYLKELDQVVYDLFKIVSTHLETRTNDINKTLAYYFEEWLEQLREVREKNPLGKKILPTGKIPNSTLISLLGKDEEELKAIKKAEKDLRLISAEIRHLRHLRPEESSTGIVDENLKHYIDSLFFAKDNHMGSVVADRYIIRKKDGDFLCDNKPLYFPPFFRH